MIKSEEELRIFYDEVLAPKAAEANLKIGKNLKIAGIYLLIFLVATGIYYCFHSRMATLVNIFLWVIMLFCGFATLCVYVTRHSDTRDSFVKVIVPRLIAWLPRNPENSELTFYLSGIVDLNDYCSANVYPGGCRDIGGQYRIEGVLENVSLRFGEVHSQLRRVDGKVDTHYDFCGLVIKLSFNKNFNRRHYIIDKKREKEGIECVKNNGIEVKDPKIVKGLEDIEFNRRFTVFSEDETEARYLLSPSFMAKLVAVRNKLRCPVCATFPGWRRDSVIHILLSGYTDILDVKYFKKADFDAVLKTYRKIVPILHLVQYFDLDQRLWSKTF